MKNTGGRPKIPAQVKKILLIECGYRCTNCGDALPLELAHIIPWRKKKSISPEDLLAMCSSCHNRADREGWGADALRYLKSNPWILRKNGHVAAQPLTESVEIFRFTSSHGSLKMRKLMWDVLSTTGRARVDDDPDEDE